ncbi:hypothetical protein HJ590_13180 [Naumannella sp. ID2617S]|nr:hypothetical protein [Naumannella sp. ID2617S]
MYVDTSGAEQELPPLADPAALSGLGTLATKEFQALCQQVRTECGWHIAPTITETMTLDNNSNWAIVLPTKHARKVTAVRIFDPWTNQMRPLPAWNPRTGWNTAGVIASPDYPLPNGLRVIEVDVEHGYAECPVDLLRFIAKTAPGRIVQESLAGRSVTLAGDDAFRMSPVIGKYRLEPAL